jgi:hypothetical protein
MRNDQYSNSRTPPDAFTSATSPACLPINARAIGEAVEIAFFSE